ncbi:MAG: AAA family ATPase, partial [Thermofilum sp.]
VPPPDEKARFEILKVHTRRMPLAEDVNLAELAKRTEGYTGADLAAVCKEAALAALREAGRPTKVTMSHFLKALDAIKPSVTKEDLIRFQRLAEEFKRMVG